MPKSRKRRPPRARHTGPRRRRVATVRPGQDLTPLLTPDDIAHFAAAIDAAARGDVDSTIENELAGLVVEESLTVPILYDLLISDPAPAWAYSRWCADQAMRWMLFHEDPRTDEAVRLTLSATHVDKLEALIDEPIALTEYGTLVAACDWVCHQLAIYEFGGLSDFLDVKAEQVLIDKTDRVRDWPMAPIGAYDFMGTVGSSLVLRDMATNEEVRVLNVGAMAGRGLDERLVGRIVPISSEPGLMFESRPIAVDIATAEDVAARIRGDEPLGWLVALADARDDGRLPIGFSCTEKTSFTSDLPVLSREECDETPAPRMQDLMRRGHSQEVANAIGVLEVGLIAAHVNADAVGPVVPHVTAALRVPGAFEAAIEECTGPDTAQGWLALADAAPEHVRDRCLRLAERARAA